MKLQTRIIALILAVSFSVELVLAQTDPKKKASAPQKRSTSTQNFGKSYATLRPEQKRLVDDYVRLQNETTGSKIVPQAAYDNARLSVRTTFDAVTHALLKAKLADVAGKSMGRAIEERLDTGSNLSDFPTLKNGMGLIVRVHISS